MEGYEALFRLTSCVWVLLTLLVLVAAVVAAVRVKKVAGLWVVAVGAGVLFLLTVVYQAVDLAEVGSDARTLIDGAGSIIGLLANVAMLVGLALVKPRAPEHGGG